MTDWDDYEAERAQRDLPEYRGYEERKLEPTQSPEWGVPMPWKLRIGYAWRCLTGKVRVSSDVDISHLATDGYMEGRIRVQVR